MTRARRDDAAGTRPQKAAPAVRSGTSAAPGGAADAPIEASRLAGAPLGDDGDGADREHLETGVNPDAASASHDHDAESEATAGAEDGAEDGAALLDALPLDAPLLSVEALGVDLPEPVRRPEDRERDRELVALVQTGDKRAFRDLYDRHHKRAFAVAYGVLKNKHDALDVVQEAFVKVHRHLASFQGSSSFYTWLYRIVMNLSIDQLRRRKTSRPVEYDDAIDREGDAVDDAIMPRMIDSNPRKTVIRRELMARVEEALKTLPDYHRQVIVLREIEGLSYEEMAEALEVPKGTIMSRLFHARRKMQVALQDYVDGSDLDIEE